MSTAAISDRIHRFIRDRILFGEDSGLSATTPLLELGILDSFAVLALVAHLNESYGLDIRPDDVTGRDFRDIESVTRLVAQRVAAAPKRAPAVGRFVPEGPAVFEATSCAQVFVIFTGLGHQLTNGRRAVNWPVSEFFTESGLTDRNVIVIGDPYGECYRKGVSQALPTPAKLCEWLEGWIAARPRISEAYCMGMSAGGPIAMVAGEYLRARTVWAFAPRAVRGDLPEAALDTLQRKVEAVTGKSVFQLADTMSDEDRAKIDALCTPELVEQYCRTFVHPDVLDYQQLADLAELLSRPNGITRHQVFYCPRDVCDTRVVGMLRNCPTVRIVEVAPSEAEPRPWLFSRWLPQPDWLMRDHLVAGLLLERGELRGLFPPYQPVAAGLAV